MSLFESVISWLAPPDCVACGTEGESMCSICAVAEIIPHGEHCWHCGVLSSCGRTCRRCRPSSPRHVWLSTNYEGQAQKLLQVYKFGQQRAAAKPIARLMFQTLCDFNLIDDVRNRSYLIVPVPTATKRVRERGFDHATLLAREVSRLVGAQLSLALGRLGQTRQLGARRVDRLMQINGAYYVRQPSIVQGRNILLIDDVVTTGATLRAATAVLRRANAKRIDGLVFAKRQ